MTSSPRLAGSEPRHVRGGSKIFCIGFHKTGTSSLALALERLGYRVTGPNGVLDPNIATNALPMAKRLVEEFDAFQDNPWPIIYKELDAAYPGSRFILTVREPSAWLRSAVTHFGATATPMRTWIYGVGAPLGHEDIYLRRYTGHNEAVLHHFRDRPQDLLVMDLSRGDGWRELCSFLGRQVPAVPFPHANQADARAVAMRGRQS